MLCHTTDIYRGREREIRQDSCGTVSGGHCPHDATEGNSEEGESVESLQNDCCDLMSPRAIPRYQVVLTWCAESLRHPSNPATMFETVRF